MASRAQPAQATLVPDGDDALDVVHPPVGDDEARHVAFGMGQIASSFPTAGGLYHWSSHLGGKAWGWATAWLNLLGTEPAGGGSGKRQR